jgi:hypothetical protein
MLSSSCHYLLEPSRVVPSCAAGGAANDERPPEPFCKLLINNFLAYPYSKARAMRETAEKTLHRVDFSCDLSAPEFVITGGMDRNDGD